MPEFESVLAAFNLPGLPGRVYPIGNGHIHDTYRVENLRPDASDFLLQRINHQVFPKVDAMMENIQKVIQHLHMRNAQEAALEPLKLFFTHTEKPYYLSPDGAYWRVYAWLHKRVAHEVAENPEQIFEGAYAFGTFLRQLADFPVNQLAITIPKFHHLGHRLSALKQAHREPKFPERKYETRILYQQVEQFAEEMLSIQRQADSGAISYRLTHNDTKFNNVLLGPPGILPCVIDLDTVMPGLVHYDVGDGVRTSVCVAAEDEPDLSQVSVDMARFEAFVAGYLEGIGDLLTEAEIHFLGLSGAMMAFIMGVRFLTDYLDGDHYYNIHDPRQNLRRARMQLTLAQQLLRQKAALDTLIRHYAGG